MYFQFLGTAAYEGYPSPFCACENCQKARKSGNPHDQRLRSSALIDQELLVDFGPDLVPSLQKAFLDVTKVRVLLITHSHPDHLFFPNFSFRLPAFSGTSTSLPALHVVASSRVCEMVSRQVDTQAAQVELHALESFESLCLFDYNILAVPAVHQVSNDEQCMVYVVEKKGKRVFYGTDTGFLGDPTLDALENVMKRKEFDLVVLDASMGFSRETFPYHLNAYEWKQLRSTFVSRGLASTRTRFFAHHFSHHNNPPHDELVKLYSEMGGEVAFDGLEIVV